MSKKMQNLVFLMKPSVDDYKTPLRAGNMILNRFCVDEDAAFELSGVYFLEKMSERMIFGNRYIIKAKGKEYSF